ncbi:unnamed protein product [Onchocerca flexuosa]|uniref:Uncharacterized protein n=1 Tax=Onchocerca flexuosa TaxID=387005 RepID=A0A183HSZ4_9BILA|nr:unnamed protein product [Onchocerca flexuosa]
MKQRKAVCELVYKQEEARMLGIRRRVLSEREERKRIPEVLQCEIKFI